MKKVLYTALFLVMSCLAFTACSDDEGGNSAPLSQTPALDSEGMYVGKWTYTTTEKEGVVEYFDGTVTLAAVEDNNYLSNIKVECSKFTAPINCPVNVSTYNWGYPFMNKAFDLKGLYTGTEGVGFAGNVKEDGTMVINIAVDRKVVVKGKPKNYTDQLVFNGTFIPVN